MTRIGDVNTNPLLFLNRYTLANPVVVWALERGLLDEWCPKCGGRGFTADRPCGCMERGCTRFDDATSRLVVDTDHVCTNADPCRHCRRECPRLRPERAAMANDVGDAESLSVARLLGLRIDTERVGLR